MKFRIDKKMLNIGTGIYTGVVIAQGLDNVANNPRIDDMLQKEVAKIIESFSIEDIKNIIELSPYRNAMREIGINPTKYPCSIEALLNRIVKKGQFLSISPVVDLANYISLKYKVPVGVHDMNSISNNLTVRLANELDCQNDMNNLGTDVLREGEPIYVSEHLVRTRRWFWRQMPLGRVNERSTSFIFPIDGFECNKDVIDNACKEFVKILEELFKVDASFKVISRENPEVQVGQLTEEEKKIENQLAIMLKGVAQHTAEFEIREKLSEAYKRGVPLRIKLGLDPSAPDIHLGHSVVLRKIRQLQDMGHIAIIIIGDYTGMIGDPTGKSKTRKQLTPDEVKQNANTYMEQIFKIIDRNRTEVYYNSEWLSKMKFGDVIELASKCTVARMMERDDFNNRYTNHIPLSVHEFFYPLMQAYDSVVIKADVELGGTDQTFNILLGRNIQRDYGQKPQLTLFMPLLEGIDGVEKMSKSLGNYVGICEEPGIIYEKIMKIPDNMIIRYYNLCTDVHPDEIRRLEEQLEQGVNPRDIKMMLAYEITKLYTGKEAAEQAEDRFKKIFQKNQVPEDVPTLKVNSVLGAIQGESILNELIVKGYFNSKSEVRRVFEQGGATVDGARVTDVKSISLLDSDTHILKIGKNKFFKIKNNK